MAPPSATKMPQSPYHLYFRFYRNVLQHPSLRMESITLDKTHIELYKSYVKMVIDSDLNDLPFAKKAVGQNFLGNDSFVGMSKKVSQKWKEAGELTRSIFKELAKEDRERYKRELFDSYQSFTRTYSAPIPALGLNVFGIHPQPQGRPVQDLSIHKKVEVAKSREWDREMETTTNGTKPYLERKNGFYSSQNIKAVRKLVDDNISPNPTSWVESTTELTTDAFFSGVTFAPHKNCAVDNEELNDFLLGIDLD
eukprot:CCRYP_001051-RA/>CCRYP_001051-RA protein AED:0.03 eAED:0.03 QI:142/1/1/1/1/1/2/188/251